MAQLAAKQILTGKQAAEILGISPITLAIWRSQKIGPKFIKLRHAIRYRLEDIEAYLEACTKETAV